ncbi:acyl-CoA dehydrogenase family protein [Salinisphaera sp. T31B1]|uniref:acyl-CoA dehydrogenase family protein n=1 Tax=Salinisphaera sp. T31B1 TaxID=727963 RepID=UPI0033400F85
MSAVLSESNIDERRMLADAVQGFARQAPHGDGVSRARALKNGDGHVDTAAWQAMAELGWLGIAVPEAAGGLGLGAGELAVVARGLGDDAAPEPFVAAVFAQTVIAACDNTKQVEALLAPSVEAASTLAIAWQPGAETLDLSAIVDRVVDGRLSARRHLVQPAEADVFVVAVRDDDGIALYQVPRKMPGVATTARRQVDGSTMVTLDLDGVELSDGDRLAAGRCGEQALRRGLCVARIVASAELRGLADRLFRLTSDYLASRKQFGQQLSSFQVLRHRAVDLYIQGELMGHALAQAVRAIDRDVPLIELERAAARAKSRCSDAALRIGREAVQLHGAIGYTEEADVGVYLRRVLSLSAWLGNATAQRREYARLCRD